MYKTLITDGCKRFGNSRWLSYNPKVNGMFIYFSDLEYEHWLLVESDAKIVEFCEQLLKIEAFMNEKLQTSIY